MLPIRPHRFGEPSTDHAYGTELRAALKQALQIGLRQHALLGGEEGGPRQAHPSFLQIESFPLPVSGLSGVNCATSAVWSAVG